MFSRVRWAVALSCVALALLAGQAAFAAENEKPEAQQSQGSDDSNAYLPPWMQKPAGLTASAAAKAPDATALDTTGDSAAKQKPPGQKSPRRHRDSIFGPGFSFFWR